MNKARIVILVAFILFFLSSAIFRFAFAVKIDTTTHPSSISQDSFSLDVIISGASEGQNYLRVDLFKDGTSNYFGETFNGSSWYKGSEGKQYFPIIIDSSKTASASVQARIGTPSNSEFTGSGNYRLRIRRYTSSGNLASSDQQDPVDVNINFTLPSPTFIPSPTSKPTPIQKPTLTIKPVNSVSPTKIAINPTYSSSKSTSVKNSPQSLMIGPTAVLGDQISPQITQAISEDKKDLKILGDSENKIPLILIGIGTVFGVGCAILSYFMYFRRKENKDGI